MKKKYFLVVLALILSLSQLTGCEQLFKKHCKEPGCKETEIYKDGYCKYHYYLNAGEEVIKDIVNK